MTINILQGVEGSAFKAHCTIRGKKMFLSDASNLYIVTKRIRNYITRCPDKIPKLVNSNASPKYHSPCSPALTAICRLYFYRMFKNGLFSQPSEEGAWSFPILREKSAFREENASSPRPQGCLLRARVSHTKAARAGMRVGKRLEGFADGNPTPLQSPSYCRRALWASCAVEN